ncbi:MAG: hypothetical protein U0744_02480 [Gemmataceae bacterium]
MTLIPMDRSYRVKAYAKRLGVEPAKVHAWIRNGELIATNVAKKSTDKPQWRITPKQAEDFERKRSSERLIEQKPIARKVRRPRPRTTSDVYEFFK